jgi:hypothetical protein
VLSEPPVPVYTVAPELFITPTVQNATREQGRRCSPNRIKRLHSSLCFFFVEEMTAQLSVASNDNASADPAEHTRQIPKAEAPKYSGRRYDIIQSSMMALLAKKKVKTLLDRPTIVFLVI